MSSFRKLLETQRKFSFKLLKPSMRVLGNKGELQLKALAIARLDRERSLNDLTFYLGDRVCQAETKLLLGSLPGKRLVFKLVLTVPVEDIFSMPIHNLLRIQTLGECGAPVWHGVMYSVFAPLYLALHTTLLHCSDEGVVAYFRQNAGKGVTFTVRHENVTDSLGARMSLCAAWLASKLAFWVNPVLLFEKNGRHCEESARMAFERLIDEGNVSARFVLSDDVLEQSDLGEQYRPFVVRQHSFLHYLYFFRCKTFLGTEAMAHCIELRCQSLLVQRKLKSRKNTYVFLQHGVMYMVSLDSPERTSFQRRGMKGNPYVVVSSQKEARHFIELAGFKEDEIIVCGLPKFDRGYLNPNADKILVMPTWRVWEFNEMRHSPESTKYVQMVNRMVDSVPAELRDKLVVASHPLFSKSTFASGGVQEMRSYDELLRDVSLLITDYSSIAYDAFYRGSNVIFYWEELEECMAHYGGNTHLMLTEETAFGPVCRNQEELRRAIEGLYGARQSESYQEGYRQIVEFRDGKNTERLLGALAEKGILQ